jgi:hypothetical protein
LKLHDDEQPQHPSLRVVFRRAAANMAPEKS